MGFDATVAEWLDRRAAEQARRGRLRKSSAQARKRLAFLCELLQVDEADVLDLRYQLLHRAAAAVLEAQRFAAHQALMLVHSFSATDAWLDDYQEFAHRTIRSETDQLGEPVPAHSGEVLEVHEGPERWEWKTASS